MFNTIREKVAGYKTYAVAIISAALTILGFFYGPFDMTIGHTTIHVPQVDFRTLMIVLQTSGVATTLRAAIAKHLPIKPIAQGAQS